MFEINHVFGAASHTSAVRRTFFLCVRPTCAVFPTQLSLVYTGGMHRKKNVRHMASENMYPRRAHKINHLS